MTSRLHATAVGLGLALLLGAGAQAATPGSALMGPIHKFIDAFNKGDIKGAEATHAANPVIIDEVAPHLWQGAGAFQAWAGDLQKDAAAHGQTDQKVTLGPVVRTQVDGDTGYAVVRATFAYKEHGKPMAESAQFAMALHNGPGGWKIAGWAWTGAVPHAAGGAAAPAKPKL